MREKFLLFKQCPDVYWLFSLQNFLRKNVIPEFLLVFKCPQNRKLAISLTGIGQIPWPGVLTQQFILLVSLYPWSCMWRQGSNLHPLLAEKQGQLSICYEFPEHLHLQMSLRSTPLQWYAVTWCNLHLIYWPGIVSMSTRIVKCTFWKEMSKKHVWQTLS